MKHEYRIALRHPVRYMSYLAHAIPVIVRIVAHETWTNPQYLHHELFQRHAPRAIRAYDDLVRVTEKYAPRIDPVVGAREIATVRTMREDYIRTLDGLLRK
jgi:hypothetical protein